MGLSDSLQGRFAGYVFPPRVGRSRSHPAGPPRLLDRSFHARCPQPPRKVRWLPSPVASPAVLSGFILFGGLATFVFLSRPNRVHLRCGSRVRLTSCLLYTSDAADEEDSVDLGGRRIIKKKKNKH